MENTNVNWLLLLAAGATEIMMAVALKLSDGWTRPGPGAAGIALGLGSMVLLTYAMRGLPTGTAYAIWTGIGAVGTALIGIGWFGDSASLPRLACLGAILCGMVGLKLLEN